MAEKATAAKKATKKVAEPAKAETKKVAKKATEAKKSVVSLSVENVGFKAGDVYQALATAAKAFSVSEIAKAASITTEETYLGIGWLMKEGKVKEADNKVTLA